MTIQIRPRHPEKAHKADSAIPRKPRWIRKKKIESAEYYETRKLMRQHVKGGRKAAFCLFGPGSVA